MWANEKYPLEIEQIEANKTLKLKKKTEDTIKAILMSKSTLNAEDTLMKESIISLSQTVDILYAGNEYTDHSDNKRRLPITFFVNDSWPYSILIEWTANINNLQMLSDKVTTQIEWIKLNKKD